MDYKGLLNEYIEKETGIKNLSVEVPKNSDHADFAFPCFKLAKELKKSPVIIANELQEKLSSINFLEKIESVNGFLNFFIDKNLRVKNALLNLDYNNINIGDGKTVVIDYSSINIAKPFHIGHLSTTAIGNSLYRIFNHLGYKSFGINYLGDYGTQFGKMIVAFKKWGDKQKIDELGIREMYRLYVKYHDEAEKDKSLDEEARNWFLKIEEKDSQALEIFNWMKQRTIKDVEKIYDELGVTFDSFNGESFYNDKMQPVIDKLKEKNLLKESEGAFVVDLEEDNMPPCLILKKDGATLYATRDLASAIYRKENYDFCQSLYVVAYQQNLHFKQVFKVLEKMGYDWASDCHHVEFGMTSMENGTMSTRKGKAIFLEDVLDSAYEKTINIINEKNPNLDDKENIARQISTGAVIFSAVSNNRINDITFSYDKILNFDGETAPYIQYTHARCCSLMKKCSDADFSSLNYSLLTDKIDMEIIKQIESFKDVIITASKKYEPCFISRYLLNLCSLYNKFYFEKRIIGEKEQNERLYLTSIVKDIISTGLYLIGIKAPQVM